LALRKKELVIELVNVDHFYRADAILFLFALGIGAIVYKFNEWYSQREYRMQENEESIRKFNRGI